MKHNRTSKSLWLVMSLSIALAMIITACGLAKAPTFVPTATSVPTRISFVVPSYSTTSASLSAATVESKTQDDVDILRDESMDNQIVQEGFLGILVPQDFIGYALGGKFSVDNYGQTCSFVYNENPSTSDHVDVDATAQIMTLHVRTTTMNQDFIAWCMSKLVKKTVVYVVSAARSDNGFAITVEQKQWTVQAIFRLDD